MQSSRITTAVAAELRKCFVRALDVVQTYPTLPANQIDIMASELLLHSPAFVIAKFRQPLLTALSALTCMMLPCEGP